MYEDASLSQPLGETELRTQLYRPLADDTARRAKVEPSLPAKRGVPLVLVLLGFLLVGFLVVAGVMVIFKR